MQDRVGHSIGLLMAIYVVVAALLVLGSRETLRSAAWELMESTARMVGYEIASAMSETVHDEISRGDEDTRRELLEELLVLVRRSVTVEHATIVGADGRVVATTKPTLVHHRLAAPDLLFGSDHRARIHAVQGPDLRRGLFLVEIPFLEKEKPFAYLRLSLRSGGIADLYRSTYLTLVVAAGTGVVIIGTLAFLLHVQYRSREAEAVRVLTEAVEGRSDAELQGSAQLLPILGAADRLRSALSDQRARTEEAREQLLRLGLILNVGVVLVDADGRIERLGKRSVELLGIADAASPEAAAAQRLAPLLERIASSPDGGRGEVSFTVAIGRDQLRELLVNVTPTLGDGAMLQLRDRQDLEALQRDLLEAARLRSLNRLYQGVAHDLKAPLNAMVLNLETLRAVLDAADLEAAEHESQQRAMTVLGEELRRLRRSLETLLASTSPFSEGRSRVDAADLLGEVEGLMAAQARQQRVALDLRLPGAPAVVEVRRDRIKQAILNLVVNALEVMPEGGKLTMSLVLEPDRVRIEIEDTGSGVPEEIRERLFEMRATTKATGTGIGLHIARAVVEAENGAVRLKSTGAGGTVFEVELPRPPGLEEDLRDA